MKRFVVKSSDGQIDIVSTSGFTPVGAICPAHDDWRIDEISYDLVSNLVFLDPSKIKHKREKFLIEKYEGDKKRRAISRLEWKMWLETRAIIAFILTSALIGFLIGISIYKIFGK